MVAKKRIPVVKYLQRRYRGLPFNQTDQDKQHLNYQLNGLTSLKHTSNLGSNYNARVANSVKAAFEKAIHADDGPSGRVSPSVGVGRI